MMRIIWCLLLVLNIVTGREITTNIEPGTRDCFFQAGKAGETIDIEYQVIDGGHGDFDISFELIEPTGRLIYSDYKKSENIHRHSILVDGDYQFCFDNTFSSFNRKTVFFELLMENDESRDRMDFQGMEGLSPEEFYDMKAEEILDYIGKIRMHLQQARQIQDFLKSMEARDRNTAEENFFRVNTWSMFQMLTMVLTGLLQVFMVRSIFEVNSTIWKKIGL
ncbi:hypothetical protein ACFFRR_001560 [Megaselia abdita]